ncbi:hypothetical protein J4221_05870 [Candidatus Pacearchaeota archaeon]|nr:hypothetical protein [Candidatus Pacearchaeota archaeon]
MSEPNNYRGYGWSYTYTTSLLTNDQRDVIKKHIHDMYLDGDETKRIKGEDFEGLARKVGNFPIQGILVTKYEIELTFEKDPPVKCFYIIRRHSDPPMN